MVWLARTDVGGENFVDGRAPSGEGDGAHAQTARARAPPVRVTHSRRSC